MWLGSWACLVHHRLEVDDQLGTTTRGSHACGLLPHALWMVSGHIAKHDVQAGLGPKRMLVNHDIMLVNRIIMPDPASML